MQDTPALARAVAMLEDGVLVALCESAASDWPFQHTRDLCRFTGLDRDLLLTVLRRLRHYGLAEFRRGLFTEWGEVAGSGYAATEAGVKRATALREAPHA